MTKTPNEIARETLAKKGLNHLPTRVQDAAAVAVDAVLTALGEHGLLVEGDLTDETIERAVAAFLRSQGESEDGPSLVHKNMEAALRAARVAPVTPSEGGAMGSAIRDAEDRRSLAEAEANGWPIVRRNAPSADREQRLREHLHQRPRSVAEGHAMAASFRAGWDAALAVPPVVNEAKLAEIIREYEWSRLAGDVGAQLAGLLVERQREWVGVER